MIREKIAEWLQSREERKKARWIELYKIGMRHRTKHDDLFADSKTKKQSSDEGKKRRCHS